MITAAHAKTYAVGWLVVVIGPVIICFCTTETGSTDTGNMHVSALITVCEPHL